jgi:hypothetical protein
LSKEDNSPAVENVKQFYEMYHQYRERKPDVWIRKNYWPNFIGKTLEVGAGKLIPPRANYYVLDLSFHAMRYCHEQGTPSLIGNACYLPFLSQSFDTLACYDVLEHVAEPVQFISELCRVAKKRVIIAGPNFVQGKPGGLDRFLPLRLLRFMLAPEIEPLLVRNPHLKFDEMWQPDRDAIILPNVGFVAKQLIRNGFRVSALRSWEHAQSGFNHIPVLKCLGQFMFVIGDRTG